MEAIAQIAEVMLDADLTDGDKLDEIRNILENEGY